MLQAVRRRELTLVVIGEVISPVRKSSQTVGLPPRLGMKPLSLAMRSSDTKGSHEGYEPNLV